MASNWNFHPSGVTEPVPNGSQYTVSTSRDFGTYSNGDMTLQDKLGTKVTKTWGYILGTDAAVHESEAIGFISTPLKAQVLSGSWSVDLYGKINAAMLAGSAQLNAGVYRWLANDTIGALIGAQQITSNLTTTDTLYTLTFSGSTSQSFAQGDRLYLEVWASVDDDPSESGGILTITFSYDAVAVPSILYTPNAQIYVPRNSHMMLGINSETR